MSLSFDDGAARVHVFFRWEAHPRGELLAMRTPREASNLLRRIAREPGAARQLARLAAAARPGRPPLADTGDLIDEISHWVASGVVRVTREPMVALFFDDREGEEEAPAAPVATIVPEEVTPEPVELATFADAVEASELAAVLLGAAVDGVAFCEECQKIVPEDEPSDVDAEAQADTMRAAAKEGVPFCEECEKQRPGGERRAA